jgi:hypothetical protein
VGFAADGHNKVVDDQQGQDNKDDGPDEQLTLANILWRNAWHFLDLLALVALATTTAARVRITAIVRVVTAATISSGAAAG